MVSAFRYHTILSVIYTDVNSLAYETVLGVYPIILPATQNRIHPKLTDLKSYVLPAF